MWCFRALCQHVRRSWHQKLRRCEQLLLLCECTAYLDGPEGKVYGSDHVFLLLLREQPEALCASGKGARRVLQGF